MVGRFLVRCGWVTALLLCLLVLAAPAGAAGGVSEGARVLEEILEHVHREHVRQPAVDKLVEGAIRGMLETLEDPYTQYFSPEEAARFVETLENSYVGVGIRLEPGDGYPVVGEVFPDSPAQKAGVRKGDVIVGVDGQDVAGMPLGEVVTRIRGPEGTKVTLTLRRDGNPVVFRLERARVAIPSMEARLLDDRTGYVRLYDFGEHTGDEVRRILDTWSRRGVGAVVLDLHDNPGGLLQSAVEVAAEILGPGRVVASAVDARGEREVYRTRGGRERFDRIIVLVNGGTASAAEILAGALRDHGRALIVGTPTVGKGTVQRLVPLESGGLLKLTIARWYTPGGHCLDGEGLTPDRPVSLRPLQLPLAVELARGHEYPELVLGPEGSRLGDENLKDVPAPYREGDSLYVPVRLVGEALGFGVDWSSDQVVIRDGTTELRLAPGRNTAILEGKPRELGGPVVLREGVCFAPVELWELVGVKYHMTGEGVTLARGQEK
ncbi:MAG: S41 family peptidase [Desulfotomaculales bacterium]